MIIIFRNIFMNSKELEYFILKIILWFELNSDWKNYKFKINLKYPNNYCENYIRSI